MAAWMENGPSRDGRHWISTPRLLKSWSRNPQGLLFSLPLHLLVHQDLLQTLWAPTLGFKPGQSLALPYTPSRQSTNGQHNEKKKGVEKIGKEVMAAKVCFPNPSLIFVLQIVVFISMLLFFRNRATNALGCDGVVCYNMQLSLGVVYYYYFYYYYSLCLNIRTVQISLRNLSEKMLNTVKKSTTRLWGVVYDNIMIITVTLLFYTLFLKPDSEGSGDLTFGSYRRLVRSLNSSTFEVPRNTWLSNT